MRILHALESAGVLLVSWSCLPMVGCQDRAAPGLAQDAPELRTFDHPLPPIYKDENTCIDCEVPVRNDTGAAVTFLAVRPSCACADAYVDDQRLDPDSQTTLHVAIKPEQRLGPQTFTVSLVESSGRQWRYRLPTVIYEKACFDVPHGHLYLGRLQPGQSLERKIALVFRDRAPNLLPATWTLSTNRPEFQVKVTGSLPPAVADGDTWVRKVITTLKVRPPQRAGIFSGTLLCEYRCAGQVHQVSTEISGDVLPLYQVRPEQVIFGRGTVQAVSQIVVVQRTDGKAMGPVKIKAANALVSARLEDPPSDREVRILVSLAPIASAKPRSGHLVLSTNDSAQPTVRIPWLVLSEGGASTGMPRRP
jgi:hypothetical protein